MNLLRALAALLCLALAAPLASSQWLVKRPAVDPFALPTPPFGSGAVVWIDPATASQFAFYDTTLSSNTLTFMEDLTGSGFGFGQLTKQLQPTTTTPSTGAPYFGVSTGAFLQCVNVESFSGVIDGLYPLFSSGLTQATLAFAIWIDPSGTAVNRYIYSQIGEITLNLTNTGALRILVRPQGTGTQYIATGTVLASGFHQIILSIDLTVTPSPTLTYVDGMSYLTGSTTFTNLSLATATTTTANLGNVTGQGTINVQLGSPLQGKIGKFIAFPYILTPASGQGSAVQTYLANPWS